LSLAKLTKPKAKKVLGIDLSTNSIAFCLFDGAPVKWGKINFSGTTIYDKIIDAHYKVKSSKKILKSDYVCIESAIMVRSQDVAIKMAMIVGAVVSALTDNKEMIVTVPPSAWQPYLGNKNFSKEEKENLKLEYPNKSDVWYRNKSREIRKQRTMMFFNERYNTAVTDHDVGDSMGIAYYAYNKLVNHA
jgi:Holliday junction resolvasome RuvABC endonuclease subunit